jgi:thiosulfate/3-mercaptopyruvate sulfurtransferase
MTYSTLISAAELQTLLAGSTPTLLLDCGFDLADPTAGERAYATSHLPGARYVHLDRDLSSAKNGRNGRHPLPEFGQWAARAGRMGITPGVQVVCYDDQGGVYAARAWWMLRWLGHLPVAVLDGGRAAWRASGGALLDAAGPSTVAPPYPAPSPAMATIDADALQQRLHDVTLLDARAPERFRGEVEPLDPVAGHIPGARCRFFKNNLDEKGCFKPAEQLRREFIAFGMDKDVVHQCGSGVTACHNLLAMAHAGLEVGRLYPGSWSEWCSDPARPVTRG